MDSPSSHIALTPQYDLSETEGRGTRNPKVSHGKHEVDQAVIFQFLARSDSFGQTDLVDRIDTMQFVLFLAGPFCFKLRRQVPLGQTQKLTLEQRHRLATQEMQMGKRFAPDLYLDLVPIREVDGRLHLQMPDTNAPGGPSEASGNRQDAPIVDWLVMLRRYDFSKSYDKQVEIYQPNFSDCERLADLITQDYPSTKQRKAAKSWIAHLEEMLSGLTDMVRQLDRETRQPTLRACHSRARAQLESLRTIIQDRGKRGLIGPIHGNIGLGNVVEVAGKLRLVNPQVSRKGIFIREWVGDPLYDLSALMVDLWSRGMNRQANWVFSHYCNRLLDSHALDGLKALDLYLFVRAMDRANCMNTEYRAKGDDHSACLKRSALEGYLKTARDSLVQDEAFLIVIGGSSLGNRSHLARLLAPATGRMPGAMYLSAQQEMLTLYEVNSVADLPLSAHRQSVWRLVYRRLADKARIAIAAGYSVILEGQFDSPDSRQNLTNLAMATDVALNLVAFHLFDPRAEAKSTPPPHDLEAQPDHTASGHTSSNSMPAGISAPILGANETVQDWTNWIELDASESVGALLCKALEHINPAWKPLSEGTLH